MDLVYTSSKEAKTRLKFEGMQLVTHPSLFSARFALQLHLTEDEAGRALRALVFL